MRQRSTGALKQVNLNYFTGRFLDLRDQKEKADEYYKQAAQTTYTGTSSSLLAVLELRACGVELYDPQKAEQ